MPNFITINKVDGAGRIIKYDTFNNEANAVARVAELQDAGLVNAFYIDAEDGVSNGNYCYNQPRHWTADPVTKTVTLDQVSFDAAHKAKYTKILRSERDKRLAKSDTLVGADQWESMDAATRTKWATYRQELRDLPANTPDPENPTWPREPT